MIKAALSAFIFATLASQQAQAAAPPDKNYLVYVVCEAVDKIVLVRFGPKGARIEREISGGPMPNDLDGPHGVAVSPDGKYYYVSFGHGRPFGSVWKYSTATDKVVGSVTLGHFPATVDLTPDGSLLYVVNFNLHGDMVPSSVSIVATDLMVEIARVQTCTMPHGSRINPQGDRQYSACMMDETLVEIDTSTFRVSRHFLLTRGKEVGLAGLPKPRPAAEHAHHNAGGHGLEPPRPGDHSCSPTWAEPSADGKSIFVACNKSDDIVEIDAAAWRLKRRIAARAGVYNLAVTRNGRLVTTNKRDQSVSVIDLREGKELARVPTSRKVVHGAVISPDDRYAFITVEGVGSEPGTLEVIDLVTLRTVARLDLPQQAAGIDFLRMEP